MNRDEWHNRFELYKWVTVASTTVKTHQVVNNRERTNACGHDASTTLNMLCTMDRLDGTSNAGSGRRCTQWQAQSHLLPGRRGRISGHSLQLSRVRGAEACGPAASEKRALSECTANAKEDICLQRRAIQLVSMHKLSRSKARGYADRARKTDNFSEKPILKRLI